MTKTLNQLTEATTLANDDLLLARDTSGVEDKKITLENFKTTAGIDALSGNVESLSARSRRNLIINGGFRINQRGASTKSQSAGVYGYDRWKGHANGIEQVVEGAGVPSGKVTLSWLGGGTGYINGTSGTTPLTVSVPSDTNISVVVPDTSDNVQLEIGDTATDFEYRPIGEELALCQRYYFVTTSAVGFSGLAAAVSGMRCSMTFLNPVEMRFTPVVSVFDKTIFTGGDPTDNIYSSTTSIRFTSPADTHTNAQFKYSADAEL